MGGSGAKGILTSVHESEMRNQSTLAFLERLIAEMWRGKERIYGNKSLNRGSSSSRDTLGRFKRDTNNSMYIRHKYKKIGEKEEVRHGNSR